MAVSEVQQPRDAASAAAILKWADQERLAVEVCGGGTKAAWGTPASRADVTLSTDALITGIDHIAGDLTAVVPAGMTLERVNDVLRRNHQWLAIDPPHAGRATIGGILAANDSGPRRHLFGTPRDLVIGVEIALVDGRTAKAGGRVVKNVAGYDLSRLMAGSFGSLAAIVSATFKLAPVSSASRTIVASVTDSRRLAALASTVAAAPLNPSAVELESPPHRLLVRFETSPAAADRQAQTAADLFAREGATTSTLAGADEDLLWQQYESRFWSEAATILKISTLPTDLAQTLEDVAHVTSAHGLTPHVCGRAGLGVLFVRLAHPPDETAAAARAIAELRQRVASRRGSVVVVSGSAALKAQVDPWGDLGDALALMRAVKNRFDPHGILNPGRGPGGL